MKFIFTIHRLACLLLLAVCICSCKKEDMLKRSSVDHVAVFTELWKVLDQRYALFAEKQVNWSEIYNQYSPRVTNSLSDEQFFQLMADMLETLKDGHVSLKSSTKQYVYDGFYAGYVTNFSYPVLLNNYLLNEYTKAGPLIYKIVDGVGYIYAGSFAAPLNESNIDEVMSNMQQAKGLILDVRSNGGGNTAMADHFFSKFIKQKTLVKYELLKRGTAHDDFFDPKPWVIAPAAAFAGKPVIVLTNRSCFSACNDFVLYMSLLDNVQVWGDQTGGGGSVPNNYLLANGWLLQYSATVTLSPAKTSIENGILPDQILLMTPIQESAGYDPLLDNAFKTLK